MLARAIDLIWPRSCAVETCSRMSDRPGRHICSHCFASLPFHEAGGACRTCGRLVVAESRHEFICEDCRRHPPPYEFARSAVIYDQPMDQLLREFKYHRASWLCEDLVDLLEGAVRAKLPFGEIDVVIPVPLHPNRERERGYNQSALLARSLAARLNRRVDGQSLRRIRDTPKQSLLSEEERRKNLDGALAVSDARMVVGRTVLLIDDVMSTGTTLKHCAAPLLEAGAARVWCATVARSTLRS